MNTILQKLVVNRDKSVKILNGGGFTVDHTMLSACLKKAAQYLCDDSCTEVLIVVGPRVPMDAPSYKHAGGLSSTSTFPLVKVAG